MELRTEIFNGQEVTVKVYAARMPDSRKIKDGFARSKARKWEKQREAKRKTPAIKQLFFPKQPQEIVEDSPL